MEGKDPINPRPVLLPEAEQFQRPRIPSANVKPVSIPSASKLPARSKLPTPRSFLGSLADSSNLQTPTTHGAFGFTPVRAAEVFGNQGAENLNPTLPPEAKVTFQDSGSKRKYIDADGAGPQAKKAKPINSRVDSLKDNKRKAARRSINNALKICQNKAAKSGISSGYGQARAAPRPPVKKELTTTASNVKRTTRAAISKPTASRSTSSLYGTTVPPKKTVPGPKCTVRSANSSRSSSGSNTSVTSQVEKKLKRKPWDLKGQVSDLKEELAISKQKKAAELMAAKEKEATIENILSRLNALEEEKQSISWEKSALSSDVCELRNKLGNKDQACQDLERRLKDKDDQHEEKIRKINLERDDLLSQLSSVRRCRDQLEIDIRSQRRDTARVEERVAELLQEQLVAKEERQQIEQKSQEKDDEIRRLQLDLQKERSTIRRIEEELGTAETDRRRLLNLVQELKGNIRVFCRVRPMLKKEEAEFGPMDHIDFPGNDEKSLAIVNETKKVLTYSFDKVFDASGTQEQVFAEVSQLVESALDGYNVCIFAYGQTGAGKTYTMEGADDQGGGDGIIPRAMKLIFQKCEEKKKFDWTYSLAVQHVEIYRETLQDLLSTGSDPQKLEIKTARKAGQQQRVWVKNLTEHVVINFNQVHKLLARSKKKRATAATNANDRSSRSHSVFMLKINAKNSSTGESIEASLNLIDLAGSERLAETGSQGVRLLEAQKINGSLSELSNVISALANKESHVPFRNSKLTFLLMDSLGGNSKTLMLVNVNPTKRATAETVNTLRFASAVNKCHIGTAQKVIKFD